MAARVTCPIVKLQSYCFLFSPQAVVKACRLATDYRRTFHRDIIVDLICYRKWGHNEVDDPSFTNPRMYDAIRNRTTTPDAYAQQLVVRLDFVVGIFFDDVSYKTATLTL